mmetsp:Transcript_57407/g.65122  ORF Transcript_57407/g.65122 Transcript_57407/m.65122 type:complete len:878 (-) Transcript_57407:356-2989(-)
MTGQNCLRYHNLLLQMVCLVGFLIQPNESLNTCWGCRHSNILLQKRLANSLFIGPRRYTVVAVRASSSDPIPPKNPPSEIFFASQVEITSHNDDGKEETSINNKNDKSTLEQYVDVEVASITVKETEKDYDTDADDTKMMEEEESEGQETRKEEAYLVEEKRIADEQQKRERQAVDARLAEEVRVVEQRMKVEKEEQARLAKEKKIAEEQAKVEQQLHQARLAEEIQIADIRRKAEIRELTSKAMESLEKVVKPLIKIQKGVPAERIKGAALAGTVLGLLASKGVVVSGAVGLSAAYVAISKSVAGDVLRTVGGISWDVTDTATKLVDKFSTNGNVKALSKGVVKKTILKYKREKYLANGYGFDEAEETAFAESDDDLARVLKQAEAVIAEADAAIARVEADQKIKEKQSSKTSIDEEEIFAEEAQIAQAEVMEEEKRIAEEANRNELIAQAEAIEQEKRIADETKRNELIAQAEAIEQEKRIAQIAEEEEMAKIAEKREIIKEVEQKVEEEEMTRIEGLEEEDMMFDDDEFMAAVEMAQEGIEGKIIGVEDIITDSSAKADWAAAGDLASELRQDFDLDFEFNTDSDMDDEEEDEDIYNLGDVDLKALAQAARDAVESYENNAKEVDDADQEQKQLWTDSMINDDDDSEQSDDLLSDSNLDELVRIGTARDAVEAFDEINNISEHRSDAEEDLAVAPILNDWSSFKVVELKKELKKRGLKTYGKKAVLVSLLEEDDAELFDEINGNEDDEDHDVELFEAINGSEENNAELDEEDNDTDPELEDFDIEELGRQARAAVEMFQQSTGTDFDEEPTEEMLAELENEMTINGEFLDESSEEVVDIAKMTVVELKEECRNRGLKVSGRKAELIKRLSAASD